MPKLKKQSLELRRRNGKRTQSMKRSENPVTEPPSTPLPKKTRCIVDVLSSHENKGICKTRIQKRKENNSRVCKIVTPYKSKLRNSRNPVGHPVPHERRVSPNSEKRESIPNELVREPGKKSTMRRIRILAKRRNKNLRNRKSNRSDDIATDHMSNVIPQLNARRTNIQNFARAIKAGPTFICSCCGGLWFSTSVKEVYKKSLRSNGSSVSFINQVNSY
jgi:hypothetical protein